MIRESLAWISALFTQNRSGFGNGKKAKVVGLWLFAVFWVLWMERNRKFF